MFKVVKIMDFKQNRVTFDLLRVEIDLYYNFKGKNIDSFGDLGYWTDYSCRNNFICMNYNF